MSSNGLLRYVLEHLPSPSDREALELVAAGSKVPYHTLLKIAKGETGDPRISTVQNLYDYYRSMEPPLRKRQREQRAA